MKIVFFNKTTQEDVPPNSGFFVVEDGTVWRDTFETYESQAASVGFDDFVVECPNIGWRVV